MEKIVIIGGGGHCNSTIDVIERLNDVYEIFGILDSLKNDFIFNYSILGDDSLIALQNDKSFVLAIGNNSLRQKLFNDIKRQNGKLPVIISNLAYVSKHSELSEGTCVYNFANVNSNVKIGKGCIINTHANVEHDCIIGDFVHVSTGVMINGNCCIGSRCFLGSSSVIRDGINICSDVIIGCGAVVVKDITVPGTYVGNPAHKL